jgi:hypothetical protein
MGGMNDLAEVVHLGYRVAWTGIVLYGLALLYSVPRVVGMVRAEKQGRHVYPGPTIHRTQMEIQARLRQGKEPLLLFPCLVSACWGLAGSLIVMVLGLVLLDRILGLPIWLAWATICTFYAVAGVGFVQVLKSVRFSRQADGVLRQASAEQINDHTL